MTALRTICILLIAVSCLAFLRRANGQSYNDQIQPLLAQYCYDCHSGDAPAAKIDFESMQTENEARSAYEVWARAVEVIQAHQMPPEGEDQPTAQDIEIFQAWYQRTFVDSVRAMPGIFRARRLSASEYRNTLRTIFGFELTVNIMEAEQTVSETSLVLKQLPTDPPGRSGFRNDTRTNPLTTQVWEQYSYLADRAIEELFSVQRQDRLAALGGATKNSPFSADSARNLLAYFLRTTQRRPLSNEQLRQLDARTDIALAPTVVAKREIKRMLVAPTFLYRGLLMPKTAGRQHVDAYELAERLSYFLWGDMPDDQLWQAANDQQLLDTACLEQQVERMLDSPKAANLATDFASQWWLLDEIDQVTDNPPVTVALKSQPIDFFAYLIAEDRPVMELIDSKITFASPLTRKYYRGDAAQLAKYRRPKGIEIEIVPNQKLVLDQTQERGGLLTMPGILAMNRGPILRGVWMLERVLGEHLPDPPADVGQVKASIPGKEMSFRERFAEHRSNVSCARCHDKIDPLGFSLEDYDSNGGYQRTTKQQGRDRDVDTSGTLPSGERFQNFAELKQLLMTTQQERILRNVVQRMLSYALARKLELHDRPTVEEIVQQLKSNNGTWRELVLSIANSLPFRETMVSTTPPSIEGKQ